MSKEVVKLKLELLGYFRSIGNSQTNHAKRTNTYGFLKNKIKRTLDSIIQQTKEEERSKWAFPDDTALPSTDIKTTLKFNNKNDVIGI